jgi:hypothetical protein
LTANEEGGYAGEVGGEVSVGESEEAITAESELTMVALEVVVEERDRFRNEEVKKIEEAEAEAAVL